MLAPLALFLLPQGSSAPRGPDSVLSIIGALGSIEYELSWQGLMHSLCQVSTFAVDARQHFSISVPALFRGLLLREKGHSSLPKLSLPLQFLFFFFFLPSQPFLPLASLYFASKPTHVPWPRTEKGKRLVPLSGGSLSHQAPVSVIIFLSPFVAVTRPLS